MSSSVNPALFARGSHSGWDAVGTAAERAPLVLARCLSYDEVKLSALLYVSSRTTCINDGDRHNRGVVQEDDVETDAVIIGQWPQLRTGVV